MLNGDGNVKCLECGKRFGLMNNAKQHGKICKPKTAITPECRNCGKKFIHMPSAVRHEKKCKEKQKKEQGLVKNENGKFGCQYCDKIFSTKGNAMKHIENIHNTSSTENKIDNGETLVTVEDVGEDMEEDNVYGSNWLDNNSEIILEENVEDMEEDKVNGSIWLDNSSEIMLEENDSSTTFGPEMKKNESNESPLTVAVTGEIQKKPKGRKLLIKTKCKENLKIVQKKAIPKFINEQNEARKKGNPVPTKMIIHIPAPMMNLDKGKTTFSCILNTIYKRFKKEH